MYRPFSAPYRPCPAATTADTPHRELHPREVLYPDLYIWFVLLSSMDIMLTWKILEYQGLEVNPIAALVIDYWGLPGAVGFKYALMVLIIVMCEVIGRERPVVGRRVITAGITLTAIVVTYAYGLLSWQIWF